jgi:hypothetical protein
MNTATIFDTVKPAPTVGAQTSVPLPLGGVRGGQSEGNEWPAETSPSKPKRKRATEPQPQEAAA